MVDPERLQVEALIRLATGMVMLVGQAWLPRRRRVTPDEEHDAFAWWPADVAAGRPRPTAAAHDGLAARAHERDASLGGQ